MNYQIQILFFFGGIGLFNSFILAIYLLASNTYSRLENKLFALFLLVLSLRVLKSLLYAFSPVEPVWFLQATPSFFLLIGPMFFTYVTSVLLPNSFWIKFWKKHIFFWILTVLILTFFLRFKGNIELTKRIVLPLINMQWLVFILASLYILKKNTSSLQNSTKTGWLVLLILTHMIVWASFFFLSFDYFVTGSIIFSILFYCFFLFFMIKKKVASKIFEKTKKDDSILLNDRNKSLLHKIDTIMVNEKLFVNPNLKLNEVARSIEISTHELSKLINGSLNKNFTDFINEYRVEEAKKLLNNDSIYTVEAIGNQSGFKSKSTFYSAFKKYAGTTPSRYKQEILSSNL